MLFDMAVYEFSELKGAPLVVGAIYKGGDNKNAGDDPLSKLLPRTENMGGFRKTKMKGTDEFAYITIFSTGGELEWPDYLDVETGIFRYYGDNREPGHGLHDTKKGGNKLLSRVFQYLNEPESIHMIPPFLLFSKVTKRDVKFLGLAVPGSRKLSPDRELVSFWRTYKEERFQNYEAYFTILDTGIENISKQWLQDRVDGIDDYDRLAPAAWKKFMENGKNGIVPLESPIIDVTPSKKSQLPQNGEGKAILDVIRKNYSDFPQGFEKCAIEIVQMIDSGFVYFDLTRPWRDGGRDAIGVYKIGVGNVSSPLSIQCALEAKLFSDDTGVTVKHMSRLISRIKYREFGVFITTSYISNQAYKEVKQDGHPILIVTGRDIAETLIKKGITKDTIQDWLKSVDTFDMPVDNVF